MGWGDVLNELYEQGRGGEAKQERPNNFPFSDAVGGQQPNNAVSHLIKAENTGSQRPPTITNHY